ncbi:P-loop containing nucleoside triphosphatehydrolases superfamily protein [Striga asiatica]|uniref:P-loop containing nucleoside triphosphatehydrolases superfamily protein n=1 Tax=Striga asiatica TaxID=4170 RepID=A0A5A7PYR4_STRAF|nr:P-loop containing nucleoside triphosphatehydrolases superfamily protein [Striga asiatica]
MADTSCPITTKLATCGDFITAWAGLSFKNSQRILNREGHRAVATPTPGNFRLPTPRHNSRRPPRLAREVQQPRCHAAASPAPRHFSPFTPLHFSPHAVTTVAPRRGRLRAAASDLVNAEIVRYYFPCPWMVGQARNAIGQLTMCLEVPPNIAKLIIHS